MSQNQKFDKNKSVEQALEIFWEKGYEATSLTDLTRKMNIGKGSFYNAFKSKRTLFQHCVDLYRQNSIQGLKDTLLAEKNIEIGIKSYLLNTLDYAFNDPKHRGCFLTNATTELATSDQQVSRELEAHYQAMRDIIEAYFIKQGDFEQNNAALKANIIITYFIGLTVQFKLEIKKDQVIESINTFIEALFL